MGEEGEQRGSFKEYNIRVKDTYSESEKRLLTIVAQITRA